MSDMTINQATLPNGNKWLKSYDLTRAQRAFGPGKLMVRSGR
jgi:hypothetical protein